MLGEEIARHGVSVLVCCLMTSYVHFGAVPHRESSLALGFGRAHWRYTRMKNFAAGVRGYLLQGRFNSCAPDESHLLAAARYVEQNPVRAGMTKVTMGLSLVECPILHGDYRARPARQRSSPARTCRGLGAIAALL